MQMNNAKLESTRGKLETFGMDSCGGAPGLSSLTNDEYVEQRVAEIQGTPEISWRPSRGGGFCEETLGAK